MIAAAAVAVHSTVAVFGNHGTNASVIAVIVIVAVIVAVIRVVARHFVDNNIKYIDIYLCVLMVVVVFRTK
jgi:hypothetical protein